MNSGNEVRGFFNVSFATNAIAAAVVGLSYCFVNTPYQAALSSIGCYALSGALTNWLAIYMLFEKVPFLYGSGVIPEQFESFKAGIRNLIMQEFFTQENVNAVVSLGNHSQKWGALADELDYDKMYDALTQGLLESQMGKLLAMVGGQSAIESLRAPVQGKLQAVIRETLEDEKLQQQILNKFQQQDEEFLKRIEGIVEHRLDALTPKMVKNIIQKMIREHLGWLVVWGGVFGGLIGFIAHFL
ncbi:DUF445 family protein [Candidatus Berkiella aquae]|uniref:DUF445 domain-containing protein n=1 Tax=Candidatus Berkiella aquae TaxID=295108 RepID=A0A0Q9YPV5_9GAMM|nr:DUF445 family protein [Candidatus Berkiella aquae]MCS5710350.1 DUF445 domain-containing protein [Candidatus Berkiella aquae]